MAETTSFSTTTREEVQSQEQYRPEASSISHRERNVGETERYGSIAGGVALVLAGIARRGFPGLLLGGLGAMFVQRGVTGHCDMYHNFGINTARPQRHGVPDNIGIKVERCITINRSSADIFKFLRDSRNLPRFMKHLERVDVIDFKRSRWVAKPFENRTLEWEVEIINEHPNELIAWESAPGAEVPNAGSIRLKPAPNGRGTEVRITMEIYPPAGMPGAFGAKLFGMSPEREVAEDLALLKQVSETGEVATTRGQPSGRRS